MGDAKLRTAAFRHVQRLQEAHDALTSHQLRGGFVCDSVRYPLVNPQRGIFKPKEMRHLLSIRTVYPREHAKVWYDDQRDVHKQISEGVDAVNYAFMGTDPDAADNRWLREACENHVPIIYFIGISPGRYQAIAPAFIAGWDAAALNARVAMGLPGDTVLSPDSAERRYALRTVKQRLHQATFREAVITAYHGRCALSGLPEPMLLDAAHIVADAEELGEPIVPNGIPLSKIHHSAFDAHLLGIDPNFKVHVSRRLLSQSDGPMLDALKSLDGTHLHLPARRQDHPDRDRLAQRFEVFRTAA